MRLNINIDFKHTYLIDYISDDLSKFWFTSIDVFGQPVVLYVNIIDNGNPFLPGVFNLSFGPLDHTGEIDDMAVVKHGDNSKVYSTILLGAL